MRKWRWCYTLTMYAAQAFLPTNYVHPYVLAYAKTVCASQMRLLLYWWSSSICIHWVRLIQTSSVACRLRRIMQLMPNDDEWCIQCDLAVQIMVRYQRIRIGFSTTSKSGLILIRKSQIQCVHIVRRTSDTQRNLIHVTSNCGVKVALML